jgi:hypothetical protein
MQKLIFILGIIFTITFALFSYWQLNDPDPILWVPIYGVATFSGIQATRNKINPELMIVLLVLSFSAGLQTWLQMDAWEGFITDGLSMKTHNQELAREAVGLWIGSFSFATFYALSKIKK